jgi:hypothetical protein
VSKRFAALRATLGLMAKAQNADAEGVQAVLEQLAPKMKLQAVSPEAAKSMRENLARKLRVPADTIASYTVRGHLSVHGVGEETIRVVEQVLRGGEEQRYGPAAARNSPITVVDVWKASREIDERVRKR